MAIDHVHALPPGTRFEEYRLDSVLGAGGFGITYRAYDAHLDTFVAIKEYLPAEFAARTEASTVVPKSNTDAQDYHWGLTRFLDEARTLARFNHPNLNRVLRFFESNGTAYMVLEYVQGETLADRLTRERQLPEESLQRLLEEVLSGLEVMHDAGYVHRDIKPGNLMLREEDGSAVVLDFGAARQAVGQRSKAITSILTPGYAPVEQYDGKVDRVGAWTDIYALGMVAYRCVSGISDSELPDAVARMLALSREEPELLPAIEAGKGKFNAKLLEAIDWSMEVDEGDRPQSVKIWRGALAGGGRIKDLTKSVRKPATESTKARTIGRRGPSWSTVALTLAISALLGAGAWWWGWQTHPGRFGQAPGESPPLTGQEAPAGMPGEPVVGAETRETGETSASAQDAPSLENEGIGQPAPREPAQTPEEAEVARLLAAAATDLKARRLTSPAGNNAWENYQHVLSLAPAHPEAMAGMERVIDNYMQLFGAEVEKEDFEKADDYLAKISELHPDSPVLETGERRLQEAKRARADRLAEQERQRRAEEAAKQAELERQRITQAVKTHWQSFEAALAAEDFEAAANALGEIRALDPDAPELAAGGQRLAQTRQAAELKELVGEMVSIPGGTFRMGDLSGEGDEDEKPVHSVTVPAFLMGKHEVTVGQFHRFVKATEYRTDANGNPDMAVYTGDGLGWASGCSWCNPGFSVGDDHPVVCVNWNDAEAFVEWLSAQTGRTFRLPTEAEWEYAARAGSGTKYHFGNSESQLCRYANHADQSTDYSDRNNSCSDGVGKRTAVVGRYQPNGYGLYDMHGNVWEWVQDCWNSSYAGAPMDGRAWRLGECNRRVLRGGSWDYMPRNLRSANRNWISRSNRNAGVGFRLALDK